MKIVVKQNPTKVKFGSEGFEISGAEMPLERMSHHVEAVYKTLKAELGSILLKAIPREKSKYCDQKWLTDTVLFNKFPDTVDEFQKAGRCFAYGENTACFFHLMRVVDFFLNKVCESLGKSYESRNWQGIGQVITKKMEETYQSKTDEWKKSEPFYAEILTDILAIGRGHRNPGLHELEKTYDERETLYMLAVVEGFGRHVAERLPNRSVLNA